MAIRKTDPHEMKPLLVSPKEAERLLGIKQRTLYKYIADGTLSSCRIGGLRRIPYSAIEEFVSRSMSKSNNLPSAS